jgi:hypothetical protein
MKDPEAALVRREIYGVIDGVVLINEIWDLSHPDCPFVKEQSLNPYRTTRQRLMSWREFALSEIKPKR